MFATYFASVKKDGTQNAGSRGAIGQPHSGIRIEASLGKYVFGVFETTSATCGELRQTASPTPLAADRSQTMFATCFASVRKRWNGPCTMRRLEAAPLCGQNVCDIFCISEKKMERVVHGEVRGSSPALGAECLRHILHQ